MDIWKTVKIFVSSTFLDMELERDKLAQIFAHLRQRLATRRLSLIPYDLRWREKHRDESLVRWCLKMTRRCQYFVAILGFRYGWRPDEDDAGRSNSDKRSITEMEIRQAMATIPQANCLYFLAAESLLDQEFAASQKPEDLAAILRLRQEIQAQGTNVYEYASSQQLRQILSAMLVEMTDRDYPPDSQAQFVEYTRSQAVDETIAQKMRGFVGRDRYLQQITTFAQGAGSDNYLALVAMAGTGKSALLAKFINDWRQQEQATPLLCHFMSMGGDSRRLHGMMLHFAEQLQNLGLLALPLSQDPVELRTQIRQTLEQSEQPLILAIDGLDEIETSAKELTWLSRNFPQHLRVMVTTRPVPPWEIMRSYQRLAIVELPPLRQPEIMEIIANYDRDHSLRLSDGDKELLQQRAAGNPLYLKVALEEIISTGIAVGQLANSIDSLFEQILQRLKHQYGAIMIDDYLGLIAASRSGLTESELLEILSGNSAAADLADDVLAAATNALDNFIVERGGLLNFFHPEFERSLKERLGRGGMRRYHQRLADYFISKGRDYSRGLYEICYQQQWAESYSALLATLTDMDFLRAKSEAGMVDDLLDDFERALENTAVPLPPALSVSSASGITVNRKTLSLLGQAIKLDLQFLRQQPQYLLQSLWNHCYWYDAPETEAHYRPLAEGESAPWQAADPIYPLLESWRQADTSRSIRIKSSKPLAAHLDSPLLKVLKGHEGWVTGIAVSPDGKSVASASHDQSIRLWNIDSGECLKIITGHSDKINAISFHPSGNRLITGSADKTARLWEVETGECVRVFSGHQRSVEAVAISPDGRCLAAASKDWFIYLWDIDSGQCLKLLKGHENEVTTVAFSPDGQLLASGSSDKTVRLWDLTTAENIATVAANKRRIYGVCFSPDGNRLISASRDDTATIWDSRTLEPVHTLTGHCWGVLTVGVSPDGKKLATGSGDKTISLWDIESGRRLTILRWHERSVAAMQFSKDGHKIISGSYDKSVRIWNAESCRIAPQLRGHEEWIRTAVFSPDGRLLASGSTDCRICVWNSDNGHLLQTLTGHQGWVTTLAFSADNCRLVSGGGDNSIRIWDRESGDCLQILSGHSEPVLAVRLSDDDRRIISGSRDKTVRIWDGETGECLQVLAGHSGWVADIDLAPDGKTILSGSHDGSLRLWNSETGECLQVVGEAMPSCNEQERHIRSVAFYRNASQLVAATRGQKLQIWDRAGGGLLQEICGEADAREFARSDTRFYVIIQELTTVVIRKSDQQPVGYFPEIIRSAKVSINDQITGVSQGTYVYLLRLAT